MSVSSCVVCRSSGSVITPSVISTKGTGFWPVTTGMCVCVSGNGGCLLHE